MEADDDDDDGDRLRRMSIVIEGVDASGRDEEPPKGEARQYKRARIDLPSARMPGTMSSAQSSATYWMQQLKRKELELKRTTFQEDARRALTTMIQNDPRFPFYSELMSASGRGGAIDPWSVFDTRAMELEVTQMEKILRDREELLLMDEAQLRNSNLAARHVDSCRDIGALRNIMDLSEIEHALDKEEQLYVYKNPKIAPMLKWWRDLPTSDEAMTNLNKLELFPKGVDPSADQVNAALKELPLFKDVTTRQEVAAILWDNLKPYLVEQRYMLGETDGARRVYADATMPLRLNGKLFRYLFKTLETKLLSSGFLETKVFISEVLRGSPILDRLELDGMSMFEYVIAKNVPNVATTSNEKGKQPKVTRKPTNPHDSATESGSDTAHEIRNSGDASGPHTPRMGDDDSSSSHGNIRKWTNAPSTSGFLRKRFEKTPSFIGNVATIMGEELPWLQYMAAMYPTMEEETVDILILSHCLCDQLLAMPYQDLEKILGNSALNFPIRLFALWNIIASMQPNKMKALQQRYIEIHAWNDFTYLREQGQFSAQFFTPLGASLLTGPAKNAQMKILRATDDEYGARLKKTLQEPSTDKTPDGFLAYQTLEDTTIPIKWGTDNIPNALFNGIELENTASMTAVMRVLFDKIETKRGTIVGKQSATRARIEKIKQQNPSLRASPVITQEQEEAALALTEDLVERKRNILAEMLKKIDAHYDRAHKLALSLQVRADHNYAVKAAFAAIDQSGLPGHMLCIELDGSPDALILSPNEDAKVSFATLARLIFVEQEQINGARAIYQQSIYYYVGQAKFFKLIQRIVNLGVTRIRYGGDGSTIYRPAIQFRFSDASIRGAKRH